MGKIFKAFNDQKGRFNRFQFWIYTLVMQVSIIVIILLLFGLALLINNESFAYFVGSFGQLLAGIGIIYIAFTSYIKRLHDLEKSGWMSLLLFIPLVNIYLWVICGFFKGTKGTNQYGEDSLKNNDYKNTEKEL